MSKYVDNMIVSSFQNLTYVLIYHAIAMLPTYLATQQMLFLLGIVDNARCGAYNLLLPRLGITLDYTFFYARIMPLISCS